MKAALLLQELYRLLSEAAATFEVPAVDALHTRPHIYLGDLPVLTAEELPDRFPFALIFWGGGENRESEIFDGAEDVDILLGVYVKPGLQPNQLQPQAETELLCAAWSDHIRALLIRNRLLANLFDLQLPLRVQKPLPEKKQHQYHLLTINTRWQYSLPARSLSPDSDGLSDW